MGTGQGKFVAEVALELGYASAFIAMFRRTLGVRPEHSFSNNSLGNNRIGI